MDDTCSLIPSLLVAAGYPSFDLDAYGFPDPGQVVKWFREQTSYAADGRKVSWTQKDLARVLGYSEVTIRNMENTNAGLDSIERRRFIIDALKIPPVLLGFGTLE